MSSMVSAGARSSTTATAVLRSDALCRKSHGTASAYRAAVVTNSQRSAAASSWVARSRFASTTESMSGASRIARPCGTVSAATNRSWPGSSVPPGLSPLDRAIPGRTRSPANHSASAGWWIRTGDRVVGRSTPGSLTTLPMMVFTSVDLPAPVEPPTTASTGASSCTSRGRM